MSLRLLMLLAVTALALFALVRGFGRIVEAVVFQPMPGSAVSPEQLGLDAEELMLTCEDGVRVHAYFLPAPGASRALLFLHGNAGDASHRLPNAGQLVALGTHVLLVDYRGYGKSEGRPSEAGSYLDARAALAHLTRERGLPPGRIVVFGRSLGGAVAVDLARGQPLAGVILESTFTSLAGVARPILFGALTPALRGRFDSLSKIREVRAPLLFFHGDRDRVIDPALGRALYEGAPEPKHFETIRGAGHNDTTRVGGSAYFARIDRFLDEVTPR